ncbi:MULTISPECIES: PAS domain-containing sensor histidine kinase [Salimicrobium]|uniref:histidine kinase n=2 Tax=Salimicrobium TaxID=351195 RepID=A0ABY1L0C5_9BACI|nr:MULTISPECIES: PAS domain-containing protein [Salimicrobium]SDX85367.1 PAS domain S-box-containing protein [Salimicrobium album]SIS87383.1 PAS domain S-box-containing protein [Salimicrobium salexigens]
MKSPITSFASIQEGLFLFDKTGEVLFANEQAWQMARSSVTDIEDVFLDFSQEELEKCEKNVLLDKHLLLADGQTIPVLVVVYEKDDMYIVTLSNIRERSRIAPDFYQPLKELLDIKYALDESSIVAVTDQRGRIKYVNRKFCEVSKYEPGELIGKDHRVLNSGTHSKEFFKQLWKTIGTGNVWRGEICNRTKDGGFYWVETTIVPFLKEDGKPYQYLAIRNEITARKQFEQELKEMATRILSVQEEEKRRLSRELHDGIGQNLYSLLIGLQRLQQEGTTPLVDSMEEEVSSIIQKVRDISWELRPSTLDELGLIPAIRSFVNRHREAYGMEANFRTTLTTRLDPETETAIYRIVQESMTNARKYAGVEEVKVEIEENLDYISLVIRDEGEGFDKRRTERGVGTFSMQERARSAGGELTVYSRPGEGTTVKATFPKNM